MTIQDGKLRSLLETIQIDDLHTLNSSNVLQSLEIKEDKIKLELCVFNPSLQFKDKIRKEIETKVLQVFPQALFEISFSTKKTIKNTIAIASGKGGVGKSTIASNLAVALTNKGYKVGLLDADIYGPSIPLMFDAENERPKKIQHGDGFLMSPIISYGVKIMSIGFFLKPNDALVWRGPMATKALKEILSNTDWGYLDYLLIDLPPGTGDIHLSLVQTLSISGAIIVTTPQPVSLIDAKKAIRMFNKEEINVPILGLVENMSWLSIDNKKYYIFGQAGGKNLSESENIRLLAELPLNQSIREAGDIGRPAALQATELSDHFNHLAEIVNDCIVNRNRDLDLTKKVKITHNRGCN